MTETAIPPATPQDGDSAPDSILRELISRISRLEIIVFSLIAVFMVVLVLMEPDILKAPFQNERTLLFTFGATALAAVAFAAMLWFRVPPVVRVIVLVVPFAIVNWWLLSPYFIDDVVDEEFSTSISEQLDTAETATDTAADPTATAAPEVEEASGTDSTPPVTEPPPPAEPVQEEQPTTESQPAAEEEPPAPPPPTEPVLLAAGQFIGLAGHSGTGDAGIFQNPDGSLVIRFENFDIENGPDLEVYLVPGADQTSIPEGSIHLGALKGNIGNQNYDLPPGTELAPGAYTALVWCEAFSVEFVGATVVV